MLKHPTIGVLQVIIVMDLFPYIVFIYVAHVMFLPALYFNIAVTRTHKWLTLNMTLTQHIEIQKYEIDKNNYKLRLYIPHYQMGKQDLDSPPLTGFVLQIQKTC